MFVFHYGSTTNPFCWKSSFLPLRRSEPSVTHGSRELVTKAPCPLAEVKGDWVALAPATSWVECCLGIGGVRETRLQKYPRGAQSARSGMSQAQGSEGCANSEREQINRIKHDWS